MPRCDNCGSEVAEGNSFCSSCGTPVSTGGPPPPPPPGGPSPDQPPLRDPAPPEPQAPAAGAPVPGPPEAPQPMVGAGGVPPPPPMQGQPGPGGKPAKKGMSKGAKIAIILSAVALLLIAAVTVLVVVLVVGVISGPADVANGYVEAINDGDFATAWGYLSEETRAEEGRSGFESKVSDFEGEIRTHSTSGITIKNDRAEVVMNLKGNDGARGTWDMYLIKEGGEWRIRQVAPRD